VIDSQIIFAIIALNACVLAIVFFGAFIFNETVRSSHSGLPAREPPPQHYRHRAGGGSVLGGSEAGFPASG
jgi:hypothetical protein